MGNLNASALTGTLHVTTADAPDNQVIITTGSAATAVNATTPFDLVTINATALAQNTLLTLTSVANASITVIGLTGDIDASGMSGVLTVATGDAADNGITITTGTGSVAIVAGVPIVTTDTVTVHASLLANNSQLTLSGPINFAVDGLAGDLVAIGLTGTLNVTTADNVADNAISIITGSGATSITGTGGPVVDTISVNSAALLDNTTLTLSGPTNFTVTGLRGDVAATGVSGTLNVTTVDVAGLTIATGSGPNIINAMALTAGHVLTLTGASAATVLLNGGDLSAPLYTGDITVTGGAGANTITTGGGADIITGGGGPDVINAGGGDDTINLANGDFAAGEAIDGGDHTDTIVLTNATIVDFSTGTIANIEILTGSGGDDTVTLLDTQWAALTAIDLGPGTNVLNVLDPNSDISGLGTPVVTNVTTGNLIGTNGDDSITLTGSQLDAIIIGNGTINLGGGNDAINLTTTSIDLNTLGTTDDDAIQGVETIAAAAALASVTIALGGQTEDFTIVGSASDDTLTAGGGNDTLTGGTGADSLTGGAGTDTFVIGTGDSQAIVGGAGDAGSVSGFDVIADLDTANDILELQGTPVVAADTGGGIDGVDSTLTIGGQPIGSHSITNGIITFDDTDVFSTPLSLSSLSEVAAVADYLHQNDLGDAGTTVAFTATIGGVAHTFVYEQVGDDPSANAVFVDLSNVTAPSLTGLLLS
jgi:Ca2+-binding RTX toxin-like protein